MNKIGLYNIRSKLGITFFIINSFIFPLSGQSNINYDEAKIPLYELPDALIHFNGEKVEGLIDWESKRKPEILALFEQEVYGRIPGTPELTSHSIIEESNNALNSTAIRKQILLTFQNNGKSIEATLLIYLPKGIETAPIFIGYNFYGNHTIIDDKDIRLTKSWVANNESYGIKNHRATAESTGVRAYRWDILNIIKAGYGIATMYYGDIDPDKNDFTDGIHHLLYTKDQTRPADDEWGSISAWAWGMMRAMDYLEKDNDIDNNRIILMGHSRLGKAALWAGALDKRFDIVISNNSGCGGAALSRRKYGETIGAINTNFPHWFCSNFEKYNGREDAIPVDQHMLISMIAPRPVYVASAEDDQWADPRGEYLSCYYASPVYQLFDKKGMHNIELPAVDQPVHHTIGYHIRKGKHDVTSYDWEQFIKFANKHFDHSGF